jgi:hypothetical protein
MYALSVTEIERSLLFSGSGRPVTCLCSSPGRRQKIDACGERAPDAGVDHSGSIRLSIDSCVRDVHHPLAARPLALFDMFRDCVRPCEESDRAVSQRAIEPVPLRRPQFFEVAFDAGSGVGSGACGSSRRYFATSSRSRTAV